MYEIDMDGKEFKAECKKYEREWKKAIAGSRVSGIVAMANTCDYRTAKESIMIKDIVEELKKQADLSKGSKITIKFTLIQ